LSPGASSSGSSRQRSHARGIVELFEILQREAQRDPGAVETFFSSYPLPRDRIARPQVDVAQNRGGRRDGPQFQVLKARLMRMPAPRATPCK